jgi:hypothetical protein
MDVLFARSGLMTRWFLDFTALARTLEQDVIDAGAPELTHLAVKGSPVMYPWPDRQERGGQNAVTLETNR